MPADAHDPEIRAFIRASKAPSYSAIAEDIAARFGPERAWPAELVRETWLAMMVSPRRRREQYAHDTEVVAFIADRAGLITGTEILSLGVVAFGKDRFPSRTRLNVLIRELARRPRLERRGTAPAA